MKLSNQTIQLILQNLDEVKQLIQLNNGNDLAKIKDGLFSILQEIDEENHRCFTDFN